MTYMDLRLLQHLVQSIDHMNYFMTWCLFNKNFIRPTLNVILTNIAINGNCSILSEYIIMNTIADDNYTYCKK